MDVFAGMQLSLVTVSTLIFAVSAALIIVWFRLRAHSVSAAPQELRERP